MESIESYRVLMMMRMMMHRKLLENKRRLRLVCGSDTMVQWLCSGAVERGS